jgi:hypothetical protein
VSLVTVSCKNNYIKKINFNYEAASKSIVNIYASNNKIGTFDFAIFGNQIENIYLDNNYLYNIYGTNINIFANNYN